MRGCIRAGARNWVISRVVGQGGGETISCHNGASLPGKLQNSWSRNDDTEPQILDHAQYLCDRTMWSPNMIILAPKKWTYEWYIEDSSDCKYIDDYCNDNDEEGDGPWKMGRVYEIDLERIKCQARVARCWLGLAMMMMMLMLVGVSRLAFIIIAVAITTVSMTIAGPRLRLVSF